MRNAQKGQALVSVIAGVALVLAGVITALIITQFSGKAVLRQLTYQGQALNAAAAGLTEGLSWFRRQTTQPVTNFAPIRDLTVTPNINDTEDTNCNNLTNTTCVGLVRTYPISDDIVNPAKSARVWGRYQLSRTRRAGDAAGYSTNTTDITLQRGKKGTGVVWQLESDGAVYVRNSTTAAYNVSPNVVLARRTMRSEIQRLAINAPSPGALIVNRSDCVNLPNTDIKIQGTSAAAIAWVNSPAGFTPTGAGYGGVFPTTQISGTAPIANPGIPPSPNRFTVPYIFGLTDQELRGLANIEATTTAALPATLPDMNLIILNDTTNPTKNYVFDSSRPLTGTGILVVFGNLTIAPNSNSVYNGLIFVRGTYSQSAPSTINGTVIVDASGSTGRTVVVQGSGEDSVIRYDRNLLNFVAQRMGLYDMSRSPYIPCKPGEICDE